MKSLFISLPLLLTLGSGLFAQSLGTGQADTVIDEIGIVTSTGRQGYAPSLEVQEYIAGTAGPMATDAEVTAAIAAATAPVASVNVTTGAVVLDATDLTSATSQGVLTSGATIDAQLEALDTAVTAAAAGVPTAAAMAAVLTADGAAMEALPAAIIDGSASNSIVTATTSGLLYENDAVVPSP